MSRYFITQVLRSATTMLASKRASCAAREHSGFHLADPQHTEQALYALLAVPVVAEGCPANARFRVVDARIRTPSQGDPELPLIA